MHNKKEIKMCKITKASSYQSPDARYRMPALRGITTISCKGRISAVPLVFSLLAGGLISHPYSCSIQLKNGVLQNYPPPFRPNIKIKVSIFTRNILTCNINFIKEWFPSLCLRTGMISYRLTLIYAKLYNRQRSSEITHYAL